MKQPTLKTNRLIIREFLPRDAEGMFEMDSNPRVHRYLGNRPVNSLKECEDVIKRIRQEYIDKGIGRWAVVEKESGEFVGWTGFKENTMEINGQRGLVDLGYRFKETAWGIGYATETAMECMRYAFQHLKYNPIYGMADVRNDASNRILQKIGMKYVNEFEFDGAPHYFYAIRKSDWDLFTAST